MKLIKLLFRIQFYDQMLFNVLRNVSSFRNMEQLANLGVVVPLQPRILAVVETSQRIRNYLQRLGTLTHTHNLPRLNRVRGDIDNLAIYRDVLVAHQLTGSSTCRSNTQTVNDVIQTALQQLKQHFTGNTLSGSSLFKQVTELFLQNAIRIFGFLLFAQLHSVFRSLSLSGIAMLSRRIVLLRKNFIRSKNTFTEFTGNS